MSVLDPVHEPPQGNLAQRVRSENDPKFHEVGALRASPVDDILGGDKRRGDLPKLERVLPGVQAAGALQARVRLVVNSRSLASDQGKAF